MTYRVVWLWVTLLRDLDILGAQDLCPTCVLPYPFSGCGLTHLSLLYSSKISFPLVSPGSGFLHPQSLKPMDSASWSESIAIYSDTTTHTPTPISTHSHLH